MVQAMLQDDSLELSDELHRLLHEGDAIRAELRNAAGQE